MQHVYLTRKNALLLLTRFMYRVIMQTSKHLAYPPVDLHWFFEISIRSEKKFQLILKKKFSCLLLNFYPSLK